MGYNNYDGNTAGRRKTGTQADRYGPGKFNKPRFEVMNVTFILADAFSILKEWKEKSASLEMVHVDESLESAIGGRSAEYWDCVKIAEVSPNAPSFAVVYERNGKPEVLRFADLARTTFESRDVRGPTVSTGVRVWKMR